MTNQAAKFWIESPLNNVTELLNDYLNMAGSDLESIYADDAGDVQQAINLFRSSDAEGLAQYVDELDTVVRESLVVAFQKDFGNEFVESVLGYEVR